MVDDNKPNPDADAGVADDASQTETAKEREDRTSRAKAFYRAMYAGEDVVPTDFGISQGGGPPGDDAGGFRGGPCPNCARLEAQVQETEKRAQEEASYHKRFAADFENYKKRTEKEREEFLGNGIQKAIEAILPALDDVDRAKQSLASVSDPKALVDGLNLVITRFAKCLESLGIKQLEVIGEQFDPRLHEPVQEIETQAFPDNAVMLELRRGYLFKDKVIRPSLVNVASNPTGVVIPAEPKAPAPSSQDAAPDSADVKAEDAKAAEAKQPTPEPATAKPADSQPADSQKPDAQPASVPAPAGSSSAPPPDSQSQSETVKKEDSGQAEGKQEEPEGKSAEKPAEKAAEKSADKPTSRLHKEPKSRTKQSETTDLPRVFDATATADLPVFEIDQIGAGLFSSDDDEFDLSDTKTEPQIYNIDEHETSAEDNAGSSELDGQVSNEQR